MLLATAHCALRRGLQCGRAACSGPRSRRQRGRLGRRYSSATKAAAQGKADMHFFRARPIAPYRERQVSARTTSAPQLRVGGGIPRLPALAWSQSDSRWTMSGGYIDERRCVKKIAVCHCDFLKSSISHTQVVSAVADGCRVDFMLVLIAFVCSQGRWQMPPTCLFHLRRYAKV